MKIKQVKSEQSYWDEGNKNLYPWFRKGWFKRYYRKKFIRERLSELN